MITKDEAVDIAKEWLARYPALPDDEVIFDGDPVEEDLGWIFFYNSRRYLEENEESCALAGNGPLVVLHATGETRATGTARPLEEYLDELRRTL